MALQLTGAGQHYTRATGSFFTSTAFTMTFWAMLDTDRNVSVALWTSRSAIDNYMIFWTGAEGTIPAFEINGVGGSQSFPGPDMALNTWYFFAITRNGVGANNFQLRYATASTNTLTVVPGSPAFTVFTPIEEVWGTNYYDTTNSWWPGRIAAAKEWDVALTATEIEVERWSYMPIRHVNLLGWRPFLVGGAVASAQRDWGPNIRTLSVGTGSSTTAGPPIVWSPRQRRVVSGAAAAASMLTPNVAEVIGVTDVRYQQV